MGITEFGCERGVERRADRTQLGWPCPMQPWRADLSAVPVPARPIHGCGDRVVPASHGHRLLELLPNGDLWLRPRDGHFSILDASALAMDWLRNFASRSVAMLSA